MSPEPFFTYLPDGVSFYSKAATKIKTIYAPLCAPETSGLKSAITPFLSGDIKLDGSHYITKPASREDLRYASREFFVHLKGKGVFGLSTESSPDSASVEIGPLWHKLKRHHRQAGVEMEALNFIPVSGENVELMRVVVTNKLKNKIIFTPTAAVPLFGRALSNKHDHEHVTSLLNRIKQMPQGVLLRTTMAFDEQGHAPSQGVYFVYGAAPKGAVIGSFPTMDSFFGQGGSLEKPQAVIDNEKPRRLNLQALDGKEAVGALRFKEVTLKPGENAEFLIVIGMAASEPQAEEIFRRFNTSAKLTVSLQANKKFWLEKISSIGFKSGDDPFNSWMQWVTLQPVLRRIFGCSFLPDHDYGKGGRGWRDIWQDLLSLILIEPHLVRQDLINNCAGIRIDGSNATIIGSKPGEFIADRNAITRVWMDHGAWPLLTLLLYIDQSGDFDILLSKQSYFRDPQLSRTHEKDIGWVGQYGNKLLDKKGEVYEGTVLEHLLVAHLTQFFNVGEHNIIRLEGADWNDGLDMAAQNGESVAFSSFYGGNFFKIADLIEDMTSNTGIDKIRVFRELLILLDTLSEAVDYNDHRKKHKHLFGKYFHRVQPSISGQTVEIAVKDLASDLRSKGRWIFAHIRRQEKIRLKEKNKTYEWFNGYYDNRSQRLEGLVNRRVRMTLTGQVFSIMSGMATDNEIKKINASVDRFLKDKILGGHRLNTDFSVDHYLDLGRAFGFAYGTKENGSFFSHMNVMYANSLYQRGFAREGYEVLRSIYRMAIDGARSKIYPGIPEYFDSEGRGMYHYLTGSASWMVLTLLTQVFGVRGRRGDLLLAPQLVKEEFNKKGVAVVSCQFAGKHLVVEYHNPKRLDAGKYTVKKILINNDPVDFKLIRPSQALLARSLFTKDSAIQVFLG